MCNMICKGNVAGKKHNMQVKLRQCCWLCGNAENDYNDNAYHRIYHHAIENETIYNSNDNDDNENEVVII